MKPTRWFVIDEDGQPVRPGLYEVLYEFEKEDAKPDLLFFNGRTWIIDQKLGLRAAFGNSDTKGERWRGLAEDPAKEKS